MDSIERFVLHGKFEYQNHGKKGPINMVKAKSIAITLALPFETPVEIGDVIDVMIPGKVMFRGVVYYDDSVQLVDVKYIAEIA